MALMLATLTERRDFGGDWLLERKFDGERCVARKVGDDVRLELRTGKDLTGTYPEVRDALATQHARELLLDGEVVAFQDDQTSFSRLQQRLGTGAPSPAQIAAYPVVYCVFDVLEIDGADLTYLPLDDRRARLTQAIRTSAALQLSEAWRGDAQRRFDEACRSGWEGLIAKRADAPYASGRSKDWLKPKCVWEQEFVIGGYTDPTGSRTDFGALLVGYHEDGRLRYAGKVGTGYNAQDCAISARNFDRWRRPSRRSSTLNPSRAARTGRGPNSSRRSASQSGRMTAASVNRASSGSATTSVRLTWSESAPNEPVLRRR